MLCWTYIVACDQNTLAGMIGENIMLDLYSSMRSKHTCCILEHLLQRLDFMCRSFQITAVIVSRRMLWNRVSHLVSNGLGLKSKGGQTATSYATISGYLYLLSIPHFSRRYEILFLQVIRLRYALPRDRSHAD